MKLDHTTLYFDETGPVIFYRDGTLYVEDLNPEINTKFAVAPKDLFVLGLRCIREAIRAALPKRRSLLE